MLEGKNICVTGAAGEIGSELVLELRKRYGKEKVFPVGRKTKPDLALEKSGPFFFVDITNYSLLLEFCKKHKIDVIMNMAALLSASGEEYPDLCWEVNVNGWLNCLNVARALHMSQLFFPSSIAAFGPDTPKIAPNDTILRPTSMYGVSKVSGELVGNYYRDKYGLDIRGIRYPGIISKNSLPSGGTTDYVVEIFYSALQYGKYMCYLRKDTKLPMMFMDDCIQATIDLMNAKRANLKHGADFNVAGFSFTPEDLEKEIQKYIPEFVVEFDVDEEIRQKIADSWPQEMDDSVAKKEWGWKPKYTVTKMVKEMLDLLRERKKNGEFQYTSKYYEK